MWTGAEAFRQAWSLYAGTTLVAPGASAQEGLRLRLVAGQSQYRTQTPTGSGGRGISPFVDALLGYQQQWGRVTVKVFAGVAAVANFESERDVAEFRDHTLLGPKAALETWWTISDGAWASLDLTWSAPHRAYYSRLRAAVRPAPHLSLGVESGLLGSGTGHALRAGSFVRYDWSEGEVSVSGGVTTDGAASWFSAASGAHDMGAYVTVTWLRRF